MTTQLVEYDKQRAPNAATPTRVATDSGCKGLAITHILAPLDGSAIAECTLPYVKALARAYRARITLLRVLEAGEAAPAVDAVEWEIRRAEACARLAQLKSSLDAQGLVTTIEILQGKAAEQVPHFAKTHDAHLIVLSTHGSGGLNTWNLGGTAQKVIASTHASVLIVPAQQPSDEEVRLRKMLLPLDCSQRAECILPAATALARAYDAQLILAHVVPEPEIPRRMPPSKEDLALADSIIERNRTEAERYLLDLQRRLATPSTRVEIRCVVSARRIHALRELARQEQIDLVVLSAHGTTGDAKDRYGSVASKFLQEGGAPVVILQDLADALLAAETHDTVGQERPTH